MKFRSDYSLEQGAKAKVSTARKRHVRSRDCESLGAAIARASRLDARRPQRSAPAQLAGRASPASPLRPPHLLSLAACARPNTLQKTDNMTTSLIPSPRSRARSPAARSSAHWTHERGTRPAATVPLLDATKFPAWYPSAAAQLAPNPQQLSTDAPPQQAASASSSTATLSASTTSAHAEQVQVDLAAGASPLPLVSFARRAHPPRAAAPTPRSPSGACSPQVGARIVAVRGSSASGSRRHYSSMSLTFDIPDTYGVSLFLVRRSRRRAVRRRARR
ncbi:hypothetical protein DMC30DRAFT_217638 [Rhodotorula diobovata]|uniref:Uncharacterized protein n=1 Tax=Rhodotorula diobovata TaxID=5288 RepID=A0A5C5G4T8_9BASI|nr:hypothetical protein DMC30DRAFT_217638 [Rhodotorula diobovata]